MVNNTETPYIVDRVTDPGRGGLPTSKKHLLSDAIKVAKIYAERNWSDNISPRYGKIKIKKGSKIVRVYGYESGFPFKLKILRK